MTHIVQRFERRLRSLAELAPKAHLVAIEKIKEIHRVRYWYAVEIQEYTCSTHVHVIRGSTGRGPMPVYQHE